MINHLTLGISSRKSLWDQGVCVVPNAMFGIRNDGALPSPKGQCGVFAMPSSERRNVAYLEAGFATVWMMAFKETLFSLPQKAAQSTSQAFQPFSSRSVQRGPCTQEGFVIVHVGKARAVQAKVNQSRSVLQCPDAPLEKEAPGQSVWNCPQKGSFHVVQPVG